MGMFTSVYHPEDNRELQIKTGDDDCEFYRVGDKVDRRISPNWPGHGKLFDGIYSSVSDIAYPDDWVIIKDGVVEAVVLKDIDYDTLQKEYKIERYDDSWWSQEAWDKYHKIQDELKQEWEEFERQASLIEDPQEQLAFILSKCIRRELEKESFVRKILKVQDLPDGAKVDYSHE